MGELDRTSGRLDPGSPTDAGVLGRGADTLLSPASPQVGRLLATCHQSEQDFVSLGVCSLLGQWCASMHADLPGSGKSGAGESVAAFGGAEVSLGPSPGVVFAEDFHGAALVSSQ